MSKDIDTSNYVYLCMTANGWGSSKSSEAAAIEACRSHMGRAHVKKYGYLTYRAHPDFEIDEVNGTIYTPKDHPVIRLADKVVKRKVA